MVLVVAALLTYSRRYWPVWCGLGVAACGAIYYPFVMANRPPHYYALLEFLASSLAVGAGLVSAVVGVLWLWSPEPSRPATNNHVRGLAECRLSIWMAHDPHSAGLRTSQPRKGVLE